MEPMWLLTTVLMIISCTYFLFQIRELYAINSWSQCHGQERKTILHYYLFGDKTIQNCHKIDATHWYNYDLFLRQETQKRLHILEADMIKKNIDLMSLAKRMHFLHDMFQMTAIALVSVINHYHINGLHLFWDTLHIYNKHFDFFLWIFSDRWFHLNSILLMSFSTIYVSCFWHIF